MTEPQHNPFCETAPWMAKGFADPTGMNVTQVRVMLVTVCGLKRQLDRCSKAPFLKNYVYCIFTFNVRGPNYSGSIE